MYPTDWTNDPLTEYVEKSHQNRLATFVHFRTEFAELIELDEAINEFWTSLRGPKPQESADLFMRGALLFRTAVEVAASTQHYSVSVVCRALLETAGYACHIASDPSIAEIWRNRNSSNSAKQKCRNEFTRSKVVGSLTNFHGDLAATYSRLYEYTIEFGAHPNQAGVSLGKEVDKIPDGLFIKQIGLTDDREIIASGLKTVFDSGFILSGSMSYTFATLPASKSLADRLDKLMSAHNLRLSAK